ncbi:MAG: hypothetical protein IVW57_02075 [Ktedonobacterales bacterium]|nr:hypothetical protein [Ktedonobacterales bacterium]
MRTLQRKMPVRWIIALVLSAMMTFALWRAGEGVTLVLLFALLTVALFACLSIAPDAIAAWRGRCGRWSWRARGGQWGSDWGGVREPRRPRPPFMPPRAAAAEPPSTKRGV